MSGQMKKQKSDVLGQVEQAKKDRVMADSLLRESKILTDILFNNINLVTLHSRMFEITNPLFNGKKIQIEIRAVKQDCSTIVDAAGKPMAN